MPDVSSSVTKPPAASGPAVTLGMPVYNSEKFLAASLESLLAQDFSDFELIISDNASTDRTAEICREYAARDARIHYVRQPRNIGAVANWNYLVHVARGRYFKWSSSNDLCSPQLLSQCVAALEANPGEVLCYGRTALIDDDGQVLEQYAHDVEILDSSSARRFRRACLEMRLNNAQCAVVRLDVLRKTALERSFPEGDMPLMVELALHGGFRLLPQVLLFRRMGKQSATRFMTAEQKAAFRDPQSVGKREQVVWPTMWDYLKSVWRVSMPVADRLSASAFVLRQLFWHRREAMNEITQRLSSGSDAPVQHQRVIALLGAYSSRNFGDTAIQASAIHHLRRHAPDAELVGISHDAFDTLRTHGIRGWTLQGEPGVPADPKAELGSGLFGILRRRRQQWRAMRKVAAQCDLLVVSGSGQLEDFWGGPWGHSYALFAWTLAFRLSGKRVAVLATGLDDLSTRLGKFFILRTLANAKLITFRDSGTLVQLRRLGFHGAAAVCPDLAFSYPIQRRTPDHSGRPLIVVCPISHRAFRRKAPGAFERYLDAIRDVCVSLVAAGYRVKLSNSQVDMDGPLLRDFHRKLEPLTGAGTIELAEARYLSDYLHVVSDADLVIASRLHALILSAVSATPMLAVSYSRKVTQLMADIESASYCVELEAATPGTIVSLANDSLARTAARREQLTGLVSRMAQELESQFGAVAGLLPDDTVRDQVRRSAA